MEVIAKMVNVKKLVSGLILVIISIIIIFQIVGATSTDLTNAAANVTASGLPLSNLFASNGVVLLMYMAGILLGVIGLILSAIAFKD